MLSLSTSISSGLSRPRSELRGTGKYLKKRLRLHKFGSAKVVLLALLIPGVAMAQTEDPSDVSTSLPVSPVTVLAPAFASTSCSTVNYDMSTVSSATVPTANLVYPPCGNFMPNPPAMAPVAKDMWFRVDPPGAPMAYRFTMYPGTLGFPAMSQGGMALYEAASATAPMRLIECAVGGAFAAALPSIETRSGYTPGNKLYLRVWDRSNPAGSSAKFQLCVEGLPIASMPFRGAAETACTATPINVLNGLGLASGATVIDYAFARDENVQVADTGQYVGGDLWLKVVIPASGNIQVKVGTALTSGERINKIAVTAYLSDDCNDPMVFRPVAAFAGAPDSWSASKPGQINVSCLPSGETLYLRIHSRKDFQNSNKRYGQFRIKIGALSPPYSPPSNVEPCSAVALTAGIGYPGGAYTDGNNIGVVCSTPGIAAPGCGFSDNSKSVWFKFIAPVSGMVRLDATPQGASPLNPGPAMALYSNAATSCDTLNLGLLECDLLHGPGRGARIIRTGLRPGFTYYVRVWGIGATNNTGTFRLYLEEMAPSPGHCYYVFKLDHYTSGTCSPAGQEYSVTHCVQQAVSGTKYVDVTINTDPTVQYSTSGNEVNEILLVEVPTGASVKFRYREDLNAVLGGIQQWGLYRLGELFPVWTASQGYAVVGPHTTSFETTLQNACAPIVRPVSDCMGVQPICVGPSHSASALLYPTTSSPGLGYANDLAGANKGCLDDEAKGIAWVVFKPESDGKVAFWLNAGSSFEATTDLDFAIWDVGPPVYDDMPIHDTVNGDFVCPPPYPPIRCSSARGFHSTGLMPGMDAEQEGPGGWGWLKPLDVVAGRLYVMAVVRHEGSGTNFVLNWTQYENASGVPDQDLLGICPYAMVLPVELLFLEGASRGSEVDLSWATATEKNSSHFTVERSSNAYDFTPIGRVEASGNSQYRVDYGFTDPAPAHGVNYYRLKLVDLDGSTDVSNVIAVMFTGEAGQVMVWPNPVQDQLNISMELGSQQLVNVQIMDATGRQVRMRQVAVESGRHVMSVETEGLARGAYVVHLTGASGDPLGTARFVKD